MGNEFDFSTVPAFLAKLWTLVEDPSTDYLICWDASGKSFHVLDQIRFAREILPRYFKHNNIASFIRQLNMYGFRKVLSTDALNLKIEKEDLTFAHTHFVRGKKSLLEKIKRKTAAQSQALTSLSQNDMSNIIGEVSSLKSQLDSMTDALETLRVENEVLWKEVVNLRQKHARQQQVVSKLFQFFVSLVNKDRSQGTIKRKLPLMIRGSNDDETLSTLKTDNLASVAKATPTDGPIASLGNLINTSLTTTSQLSKERLEPLAVIDFSSPQQCLELSDFSMFESDDIHPSDGSGDISSKILLNAKYDPSSDDSPSKEIITKSEPRLIFKDFDKEEFSRNLNSFQNNLDSFYDFLNSGQYSIDTSALFGLLNTHGSELHTEDEELPQSKRLKLDDDDINEGKEIIHYIPPEEILYLNDDFVTELPPSSLLAFPKSEDVAESLSPLNLGDMDFIQQWSLSDNDKII